jgi:hypothetical protein
MKLAAISMIRDEADIVASFLRHLDAMFDIVILLDQRSSDGSTVVMKAACGQRADWRYYLCDFAGRHQKEMINFIMPKAFEMGADALFVLDSDEFIALETRDELQQRAHDMQNNVAAGRFFWRACVPVRFDEWKFDLDAPAWRARKAASVQKVAISRALFEQRPDLRFRQGSHDWEETEREPPVIELGDLYHFPLRSRQQAVLKTCIGSIAYFSKGNMMIDEGWHRRQMLGLIASGSLNDAALAGFASSYSEESSRKPFAAAPRIIAEAFEKRVLPIARSDLPLPELAKPDFDAALAQALMEFKFEFASGPAPAFDVRGEVMTIRDVQSDPREQISANSATIQRLDAEIGSARDELSHAQSQIVKLQSDMADVQTDMANVQTEVEQIRTAMEGVRNINWLVRASKNVRKLLGRRIHGE